MSEWAVKRRPTPNIANLWLVDRGPNGCLWGTKSQRDRFGSKEGARNAARAASRWNAGVRIVRIGSKSKDKPDKLEQTIDAAIGEDLMSEKRVKGWAIKRASHSYWLVDHLAGATTTWGQRSERITYGRRETARLACRDAAKNNSGVTLVRIFTKSKTPQPDKLEQAIAVLHKRLDKGEQCKKDCVQRGCVHLAQIWEIKLEELRLMVKLLEELR